MATCNRGGYNLFEAFDEFQLSHMDIMILPETRIVDNGTIEAAIMKQNKEAAPGAPKLGCVHECRPIETTSPKNPGGGIGLLYDRNKISISSVVRSPDGGICARIQRKGAPAFHVIGLYMPCASSGRCAAFGTLLAWLEATVARVRKSDAPYIVVGGDFNASIALGVASWKRKASDVAALTPRDRQLVEVIVRLGLIPVHGMNGATAQRTSQTASIAGRRALKASDHFGRRERDYLFVDANGPRAHPVLPYKDSPWHTCGHVHRTVSAWISVPGQACAEKTPERQPIKPKLHVYDYSDKAGWDGVYRHMAPGYDKLRDLLRDKAPSALVLEKLLSIHTEATDELLRCEKLSQKHMPLNKPATSGEKEAGAPRRPAPPALVAQLLEGRRLLRVSCRIRAHGHAKASAVADLLRATSKRISGLARAALKERERAEPQRLVRFYDTQMTRSPGSFWDTFNKDSESFYSSERPSIPASALGTPMDTFPAAAAALFSGIRADPPAIQPETGDKWTRHIPKPKVNIPAGGALGKPFTWQEVWHVLHGPGRHAPPTPCETAAFSGCVCPRDAESMARHAAAEARECDAEGKSIPTSVGGPSGAFPAESLCWTRTAAFDSEDDAADRGATTRMRMTTCVSLALIFNDMLETGTVPDNFTAAQMTLLLKVPKQGDTTAVDPSVFTSYRGISCITVVHKTLKKMLTNRLAHYCLAAGLLGPSQAGFSHKLACENNLFATVEAIRRRMAANLETWLLFVDLKRAYDMVNHNAILAILAHIGIAPNMVALVKALLADASFRMDINGELSERIKLCIGLPQGDPLSCILFLLFIESLCAFVDWAESQAGGPIRGLRTAGAILRDLLYADDIESHAELLSHLVRLRALVDEWAVAWGMLINAAIGKTQYARIKTAAAAAAAAKDAALLAEAAAVTPLPLSTRGRGGRSRGLQRATALGAPVLPADPMPPAVARRATVARRGRGRRRGGTSRPVRPPIPPPDVSLTPIMNGTGPPYTATAQYRLLGLNVNETMDMSSHFDEAYQGGPVKFSAVLSHRNFRTMKNMSTTRQLQLRKAFNQPHAWSVISPPAAIAKKFDDFYHDTGCRILGIGSGGFSSRLLISCLTASIPTAVHALGERLRFHMQQETHGTRKQGREIEPHVSLTIAAGLLDEHVEHERLGTQNPLPNWFTDTQRAWDKICAPEIAPPIASLHVEHAFQIRNHLRVHKMGLAYLTARNDPRNAREVALAPTTLGPGLPALNGGTRAACVWGLGFLTPFERFLPGAAPLPLSIVGAGIPSLHNMATGAKTDFVALAAAGDSALCLPPFRRTGKNVTPPLPSGSEPYSKNLSSLRRCDLCGRTSGLGHALFLCPHPAVLASRRAMFASLHSKLPSIIACMREAIGRPQNGHQCIDPGLTPEEKEAIDTLDAMRPSDEMSEEAQHICLRFITVMPWPAAAALRGQVFASALGKQFGAIIAAPLHLRKLANMLMRWAHLTLSKMGAARLAALEGEVRRPTLPRPGPWAPPTDVPSAAPPADEPVPKAARKPSFAPFPARVNKHGRAAKSTWYKTCNLAGLTHILGAIQRDPDAAATSLGVPRADFLAALATATAASHGKRGTKAWLTAVLAPLELRYQFLRALTATHQQHPPAPPAALTCGARGLPRDLRLSH